MPAFEVSTEDCARVRAEIRDLGLEGFVAELDANGLAAIPPEYIGDPDISPQLLEAVIAVSRRRTGIKPELTTGTSHQDLPATAGQMGEQWMWRILFEDPVFEQALMNRTALALVSYLLGYSAKLSNCSAVIKGPVTLDGAPKPLGLHSDNRGIPAPFPQFSQVANLTWVLTDYTFENGCVGYVPGSHRLCRHPAPGEAEDEVVPVEVPAGTLLVWHGNTWHAPFPRSAPGLRVSMLNYFCREYIVPQERYREEVPRDSLRRNPERFATLMGLGDPYGWDEAGPDMAQLHASRAGRSEHA